MPLSINVGLARKASRDYQSAGVSINVTAELDQALLARPQDLQQQIEQLYNQAQAALDRRAALCSPSPEPAPITQLATGGSNGAGRAEGANGHAQRLPCERPGNGERMITPSQRRAVDVIAQRLGLDANLELRDVFGWELDRLTLRQASQFIEHLSRLQCAASARSNGH